MPFVIIREKDKDIMLFDGFREKHHMLLLLVCVCVLVFGVIAMSRAREERNYRFLNAKAFIFVEYLDAFLVSMHGRWVLSMKRRKNISIA